MHKDNQSSSSSGGNTVGPIEQRARRLVGGTGAILLLLTVGITTVDVFGRYFFNAPLRGGFELTEVLMLGFIFPALPLLTWERGHITVDLFSFFKSSRAQHVQSLFVDATSLFIVIIMMVALMRKSRQMAVFWDFTDTLRIPLAPLAYFVTVMLAATALVMLIQVTIDIRRLIR